MTSTNVRELDVKVQFRGTTDIIMLLEENVCWGWWSESPVRSDIL